jgi:PAS domain S-box-containing protein
LLRVRPYRTTDNKIDGLVVVLVDIDQLRRSQQELREARDYARSIIESVPLPLAVLDLDLKIRSTNEAFCVLSGSTSSQLELRFLPDLAAALWGLDRPLQTYLDQLRKAEGGLTSFQFEHKTPGDESKVFLIRGCLLRPDGVRFLLVTFEDITAHKEVERLLKVEGERLAGQVELTAKELERSEHQLRALTGSLFAAQEEERRRVARELHDDVSQRLAKLDLDSDAVEKLIESDKAAAKEMMEGLRSELADLATDVRRVSHRLHPSALEDLGLPAALEALVEEFGEREQMITTFFGQLNAPLSIDVATSLFRITHEALRNIAKHAGRTHVKVDLRQLDSVVQLQVVDFGAGFDPANRQFGLGIISMEERARLIESEFNVRSAPGRGTQITVTVPLSRAAAAGGDQIDDA